MNFIKEIDNIYRLKVSFESVYTSVFLVKGDNCNVIVDCATTDYDVTEYIIPAIKQMGIALDDVNYLVITHPHGDHAGGKDKFLQFCKNAKVVDTERDICKGVKTIGLAGHTINFVGVLVNGVTLITGDGLQGAGIKRFRCGLEDKKAYLKTLDRIKQDKNIENVIFSHEYEPWYANRMMGRANVEKCLQDCLFFATIGERTMKAIVINKNDQSLSYTDVPDPELKHGQVLIEVYASALNRADLLQREGKYPPPPDCPEWPGLEVSGVVKQIARGVTKFKLGDRVCALLGGGGYAEYVAVPEEMVMPIPKGLDFVQAAAIPEVYMTAYLNLFHVGKAKVGETLLMSAGGSGLASAVIPMAKAFGLRVITTVRGEKKVKEVAYLNADRVVDLTKEDIATVLKEEEQKGTPVNIAIDCLGGDKVGECLKYVARGCRWIQIATLAGDIAPIDFKNIYVKNIQIIGSTLRSKTPQEKGVLLNELVEKTWQKFESGEMQVKVYKTFPIEQADEAQQTMYRGENIGKIVLIVKE